MGTNWGRGLTWRAVWCALAALSGIVAAAGSGTAWAAAVRAPMTGEIEELTIDDPNDHWSGGKMVVGGQTVILPRNLLIDLPANRMTLAELFAEAPAGCMKGAGLARNDPCLNGRGGAIATILANRTRNGNVIAGEVRIDKGLEAVSGTVTYIDYAQGFFRVNGAPGSRTTGLMVRLNDPESVHTIQSGAGCLGNSPNCSPDPRFTVDSQNYTAAFATGYPVCIPSTQLGGKRTTAANAEGSGDPFCPQSNREGATVSNSVFFAPLQVGDHVRVEGNYEVVGGTRFLSAWHMQVNGALATRDEPTQPDYVTIEEIRWDVPGFQNERVRFLLIGFTTLPNSPLDVYGIHYDAQNQPHEVPVSSTVNNPDTINQGIAPSQGGIFKILLDVDFFAVVNAEQSPCRLLRNAGLPGCPLVNSLADEVAVLSPVARELAIHTRRAHPLAPGITALNIRGEPANSNGYLTPVTLSHPDFVEINLGALQSPFDFSGIPWNMDRRLGPGGCEGTCESMPQPLDPFPFEDVDPRTLAAIPPAAKDRMFAFYPFGPNDFVRWPPVDPAAMSISETPPIPLVCGVSTPPATLSGVTPSSAVAGTAGTAIIEGTNFVTGTTCSFGSGVAVACQFESATRLTAVYQVDPTAAPGPRDVTITTPGAFPVTLPGAFTIAPPPPPPVPPTLTAVTPSSGLQGGSLTVALTGTDFRSGMSCSFGAGITVTRCTVNSPTSANADLSIGTTAAPGARTAMVTNTDGTTAALANAFTVNPLVVPPPTLSQLIPETGTVGTSLSVQLLGSGFVPGSTCDFGPGISVLACTATASGAMTANVQIALNAPFGAHTVRVINPDGRSAALFGGFTVMASAQLDTVPPVATAPTFSHVLRAGLGTTTIPLTVAWSGTDANSGIGSFELERSENGGLFRAVNLVSPTTHSVTQLVTPGVTYQFRARAIDNAGNVSAWAEAAPFRVDAVQESSPSIVFSGTWQNLLLSTAYGGALRRTTVAGNAASLDFVGSHVAWIASVGPGRGLAEVRIDGVLATTVDLRAAAEGPRSIVFSRALSSGSHRIEVRHAGPAGSSMDVDAFIVHR